MHIINGYASKQNIIYWSCSCNLWCSILYQWKNLNISSSYIYSNFLCKVSPGGSCTVWLMLKLDSFHDSSYYAFICVPYSGKFSEINIFGNYNEKHISEIKFRNLVLCAMSKHKTTGKLLWHQFFGNKISESEPYFGNFRKYLPPKISRYTVPCHLVWKFEMMEALQVNLPVTARLLSSSVVITPPGVYFICLILIHGDTV